MKQLLQRLGSGEMGVQEVADPQIEPGRILVRNHFSVISPGTEGATVTSARKSLLAKAKERPDQVRQVLDVVRRQGPVQAYRAVTKRLESYSPLGYSCAGEVIGVGAKVRDLAVGDRVACGGNTASHAELVSVPINLAVPVAEGVDLRLAAYNTLGAIALQGIRQAGLGLGESCLVIGLGVVGQLTSVLLRASGVRALGVDVDPRAVAIAAEHACDRAFVRTDSSLAQRIAEETGGVGVDAVIITAGTDSLDPINFAGEVARPKGRVVVVGAVPTGFAREHYYRKELEVRMSCSYGPGRYDPAYEEKGIDYPVGYVRWTERRNMMAFQELLASGRIDIGFLTSMEVPFLEAPSAYESILSREALVLGVVLAYDTQVAAVVEAPPVATRAGTAEVNLAFVGAGSYAQGSLLPNLPEGSTVARRVVVTRTGATAKSVAERFGFEVATTDAETVFGSDAVNTVVVATRHDSHAAFVLRALEAGKNVLVEKPLAISKDELTAITEAVDGAASATRPLLMVGFNRRFAPLVTALREALAPGPMAMVYRVNAGPIPADSWIQDPEVGGGRIVGECCHFIDLMTFLCGSPPCGVFASALDSNRDSVAMTLDFADGSIGSLVYVANGSPELTKERLEVSAHGCSAVLEDFRRLELYSTRRKVHRRPSPAKGQKTMLKRFLEAVEKGGEAPIPPSELLAVSRATFAALESLRERRRVEI